MLRLIARFAFVLLSVGFLALVFALSVVASIAVVLVGLAFMAAAGLSSARASKPLHPYDAKGLITIEGEYKVLEQKEEK